MLGLEEVIILLAAAWFVDFAALFPVGAHLIGWGKGRPVWTILFIGGLIHFVLGISAATVGGDPLTGFAIMVFGWIFVGIGFMVHRGYDPVGVGHLALFTGIIFLAYAVYYGAVYGGTYGWLWALIMVTIFLILLIVAMMDYGKVSERFCGIALMVFALEALIIGTVLILGVGLETFGWITGI
ncbi:hypothetical protein AMET1_0292 [Methanonatronarchaeum thermophilum]|uniref:Uncharacterized protein n=1 Tax=Methanonatronarchaeum thermophilum TaxID=1927129 RepID=A0A1Y3GH00_9EURY|nr:hypothetical protein [Methanonatronarchaeum thermophilum]OUJ18646.1 hypothetical protein AMET1_0292 [Methanonatronarchaeum thermophilum]